LFILTFFLEVLLFTTIMSIVYYGSVVSPVSPKSFHAFRSCLLAVGPTGNIDWIVEDVADSMVQETMAAHGYIDVDVVCLTEGEFIMPGLIDTHTVGRATDLPFPSNTEL
jgi:guanine deaminase